MDTGCARRPIIDMAAYELNLRARMVDTVLFMTLLAIVIQSLHLDLSAGKADTS